MSTQAPQARADELRHGVRVLLPLLDEGRLLHVADVLEREGAQPQHEGGRLHQTHRPILLLVRGSMEDQGAGDREGAHVREALGKDVGVLLESEPPRSRRYPLPPLLVLVLVPRQVLPKVSLPRQGHRTQHEPPSLEDVHQSRQLPLPASLARGPGSHLRPQCHQPRGPRQVHPRHHASHRAGRVCEGEEEQNLDPCVVVKELPRVPVSTAVQGSERHPRKVLDHPTRSSSAHDTG
mmetsp:Transcript_2877/g.7831  ORF Transcript_2877/g.7831 Transcript_2877/m.7831 type:complete len:236 (-) Transcript_2877:53-760(-)